MARAKGTSRQSNGSAQDEAETPYRLNENEHGNLKDLKDDTPTEEEFADKTKFRRYKSFKLPGRPHQYYVGQYVYMNTPNHFNLFRIPRVPEKDDGHDPRWIGRISTIGAINDKNVFVKFKWMFNTAKQVSETSCRGKVHKLQGPEVIISDMSDLQAADVVDDHAEVKEFNENDPLQDPIGRYTHFFRTRLYQPTPEEIKDAVEKEREKEREKEKAIASTSNGTPTNNKKKRKRSSKANDADPELQASRPYLKAYNPTCVCGQPYKPIPLGKDMMVFCPRKECKRWYHTTCLSTTRTPATPDHLKTLRSRGLDLTEHAPSLDPGPPLPNAPPKSTLHREVLERLRKIYDSPTLATESTQLAPPDDIPINLRRAAETSIIRGNEQSGIVGNARRVVTARRIMAMCYQVGVVGGDVTGEEVGEWIERWEGEYQTGDIEDGEDGEREEVLLCPNCQGAI